MKLVEILARELVEWPEGAVYASQDKDMEVRFSPSCEPDFFATALAVDASSAYGRTDGCAIVTREMWEAERARLVPWFASEPACCHCIEMDVEFPTVSIGVGAACSPEWAGEGLPPAGTVCEVYHCDQWLQGEVIAHFQQRAGMVAAYTVEVGSVGSGLKHLDCAIGECFRPLRTHEQIAAQDREQAITDLMQTTCIRRGEAARIYDAGYRRQ